MEVLTEIKFKSPQERAMLLPPRPPSENVAINSVAVPPNATPEITIESPKNAVIPQAIEVEHNIWGSIKWRKLLGAILILALVTVAFRWMQRRLKHPYEKNEEKEKTSTKRVADSDQNNKSVAAGKASEAAELEPEKEKKSVVIPGQDPQEYESLNKGMISEEDGMKIVEITWDDKPDPQTLITFVSNKTLESSVCDISSLSLEHKEGVKITLPSSNYIANISKPNSPSTECRSETEKIHLSSSGQPVCSNQKSSSSNLKLLSSTSACKS